MIVFSLAVVLGRQTGVSILDAMFYPLQRTLLQTDKKYLEIFTPTGIVLLIVGFVFAFVEVTFLL
jgi:uncharacterized membrane protein